MRLTFVLAQANLSGGSRVVATYADALARRGHAVTVVSTPRRPPTRWRRLRARLKGEPAPGPRASHFDGLDLDHRVLDAARPVTGADLPDADAVIATWWRTAEWVAQLPDAKGVKLHFVQHHEVHAGRPLERVRASYRLPLRKLAVSRWLVDVLASEYGERDVALVPNGVDTRHFDAPLRGRATPFGVGFVYATAGFKGCEVALDALARARRSLPDLRVVCFGSDPLARRLPLPAGAHFAHQPAQAEIPSLYASCDAWLLPSHREGFGLPLLEAMACRTPVIATETGAAPDLVDGANGILVPAGDPEALAGGIARLAALPDGAWRAMSTAARQTALAHPWEVATDRLEGVLRDCVEQGA